MVWFNWPDSMTPETYSHIVSDQQQNNVYQDATSSYMQVDKLCETIQSSPLWDTHFQNLGLTISPEEESIGKYRIKRSTWIRSDRYTPGLDDIDWKDNCGDMYYLWWTAWDIARPEECARRMWSYFADHEFEVEICDYNKDEVINTQNIAEPMQVYEDQIAVEEIAIRPPLPSMLPPIPPMPSMFPMEEIYPVYPVYPDYWYWGGELEMFYYQFCDSSTDVLNCDRYTDVAQRLDPKVMELGKMIKTSFDEEKIEDIKWMIRNIIEQKFYSVSTEKAKFTISFVWVALQEYLYEEDVEDIWSRLWDAITNFKSQWKINSISEAPWDLTSIQWNIITSSNNKFGIEIEALFDSGRPVTPDQWYELMAHFWTKWPYFIDREDMRYAQYDSSSKVWKFDGDEEMYRMWSRIPDESSVTFYLICYHCDGEEFHPDFWDQKVADSATYTFQKLNDNMSYDIALDVSNLNYVYNDEDIVIDVTYTLSNSWIEVIAWARTNIWAYPMKDRGRYGEDEVNRTIVSAMCGSEQISSDQFLEGNIMITAWESCTISERVIVSNYNNSDMDVSIEVESRNDQDRNNNHWNELLSAN